MAKKRSQTFIHMPLVGGCGVTLIGHGEWTRQTYEQFAKALLILADTFPDDGPSCAVQFGRLETGTGDLIATAMFGVDEHGNSHDASVDAPAPGPPDAHHGEGRETIPTDIPKTPHGNDGRS